MPLTAPTFVYRLKAADGSLLYVGCSANPGARLREHQRAQPWAERIATMDVETHPSRADALAAEAAAIKAETPAYNDVHHLTNPHRAGRRPVVPGKPRTVLVSVRLTAEGAAALDRLRGAEDRSTYLRRLLADAARRERP